MITVHNLEDTKFTARLFRFLYPSFLHPYYLIISLFFLYFRFCISAQCSVSRVQSLSSFSFILSIFSYFFFLSFSLFLFLLSNREFRFLDGDDRLAIWITGSSI